jgi:hypothetical protein
MSIKAAIVALGALGPFSSCADFREFVLGTPPIEDKPVVLDSAPAASKELPAQGEPDPRLTIKLPGGGEASFEYAQAKRLMDRGQLMAANFVIMPKALGDTGTEDEVALLADICDKRSDDECRAKVVARKKGMKGAGGASIDELKKLAKKSPEAARALLMPRLEAGTITNEQAAVLGDACHTLKDAPCESMVSSMLK